MNFKIELSEREADIVRSFREAFKLEGMLRVDYHNMQSPPPDSRDYSCRIRERAGFTGSTEEFRASMISVMRNLYGMVAIVQMSAEQHKYFFLDFLIPPENLQAIDSISEKGIFEKEILGIDRHILRHLLNRTAEIKKGKKRGHNPRFNAPLIAKETRMSKEEVRKSLERLTGILCHTYGPDTRPYSRNGETTAYYVDNWFIPNNRIELANEVISK